MHHIAGEHECADQRPKHFAWTALEGDPEPLRCLNNSGHPITGCYFAPKEVLQPNVPHQEDQTPQYLMNVGSISAILLPEQFQPLRVGVSFIGKRPGNSCTRFLR